jgi:hypothetical protein
MITVTGKKNNGNKTSQEVLNAAISYYMNSVSNGTPYLKANEVKGLDLETLLSVCKANKAYHISLIRQIVSSIGGSSYQATIADMNSQIESYMKG